MMKRSLLAIHCGFCRNTQRALFRRSCSVYYSLGVHRDLIAVQLMCI